MFSIVVTVLSLCSHLLTLILCPHREGIATDTLQPNERVQDDELFNLDDVLLWTTCKNRSAFVVVD